MPQPRLTKNGMTGNIGRGRRRRSPGIRVTQIGYRAATQFLAARFAAAPPAGHRFALAAISPAGALVGVAIIGRPRDAALDDGVTAQITRLAVDAPVAQPPLIKVAWRISRRMGYQHLICDIPAGDEATSIELRAADMRPLVTEPGSPITRWEIRARRSKR